MTGRLLSPCGSGRYARARVIVFGLAFCWAAIGGPAGAASRPAVTGTRGMVVTPEQHATRVGLDVLRDGGNAVDAAVAVAFTLAVTFPLAGNLGGGGFMLYRTENGDHHALDFRESAPRKLDPRMFLDEEGRPIPGLSLDGGLAVGTPGSVAGLARAHAEWGSRPWASLVKPAIRLAEDGFPVFPYLAETFARAGQRLRADPEASSIFLPNGAFPRNGDRLRQKDLAASLRRIARLGRDGFYRGPVGSAVARTVQARGGVMDQRDLEEYRTILREPIEGTYRGYRVISFPPPSSGGVALLEILGILERIDLARSGPGSSLTTHLMVEAERRAYADRSRWLGDPDFFEVPWEGLLEAEYLARLAATIRPDRATPSSAVLPGRPRERAHPDTLHFSVADGEGRTVALTTTLNTNFGTGVVAAGTGILLNNEIDDFALAPDAPNVYGLTGGEANAVAGGKRPLSSMTPAIVERPGGGRPALVLGSPGGSLIITSVVQVLINVIDHAMPLQEAVDAPRFHHQWQPDEIRHEVRAFSADVMGNLISRGHDLKLAERPLGNVNAIGWDDDDGVWLGAADPRRDGAAAGF